jgi:acetyltransferase
MLSGTELFVGANYESKFGHLILCGMGGIFVEVLKDFSAGLVPVDHDEALNMIRNLNGYKIIKGIRGTKGISEKAFADVIVRLSGLLQIAPEIAELDFNPLLGSGDTVIVVDARINMKKR